MELISQITSEWVLIGFAILLSIYLIIRHRYFDSLEIIIGSAFLGAIVLWLKNLLEIPRPDNSLIDIQGYAFPSWHASYIIFLALIIYFIFIRHKRSRKIRIIIDIILICATLFIGWTRIWFQVHTPIDILGGYALGWLTSLMLIFAFEYIRRKRSKTIAKN